MGVENLSRRQFLAGSAAAGVSLSLDNLVQGFPTVPVSAEFLAMLSALNMVQDKREKVPAEGDLKEAESNLQKLFETQYKAKKPEFADVLLSGAATEEKTSKRYVMLRDSAQISAENFKLPASFAALEKMVDTYQVKFDPMVGDVLKTAKKGAKSPAQNAEFAEFGIKLAELGMKWNEYDAAVKAVNEAKSVAGKAGDKSLVDKTNEKLKEVTLLKKEFDEYVKAEDGLSKITFEDTVNDPKKKADFERFNLIAGKWQCFKEDKWNIGIYMLPMGSDKDLAAIAQKEQKLFENKIPLTAENFYAMAEDWYAKTKKETDQREKAKYGGRALHWYDKTLETATGALKSAAETRINELGDLGGKKNIVDLLKMIDVDKDSIKGKWALEGRVLSSQKKPEVSYLQIPYLPPDEYDLTIIAERKEGSEVFFVGLSSGKSVFECVLDGMPNNGYASGINSVDGKDMSSNVTTKKGPVLTNNKPVTIVYNVRKNSVKVAVDGNMITNWTGDSTRLSRPNKISNALYIGTYDCKYQLTKILITPISGQGKGIR